MILYVSASLINLTYPSNTHQPANLQVIIDDGFSMEEPVPKEIKAMVAMAKEFGSLPCKKHQKTQPSYMYKCIVF